MPTVGMVLIGEDFLLQRRAHKTHARNALPAFFCVCVCGLSAAGLLDVCKLRLDI